MIFKNIMKKLLVSFLVCAMFLTFTASVKAYSIDDLMSQLTSLQQQVNNLQSQLGAAARTALDTNTAVACLPSTTPWIKVTSPNGGETFTTGQQITVTWSGCNLTTTEGGYFHLMRKINGQLVSVPEAGSGGNLFNGTSNSFNYTIPSTVPTSLDYIIHIVASSNGGNLIRVDDSDNLFKITNFGSSNLPVGCLSSLGYSTITGLSCGCNGTVYSTYNGQLCPSNLPAGCVLSSGYSTTTGLSCGCNGTVYSTYNGQLCPIIINDSSSTLKSKASLVAQEVASPNASFKRTLKVGIKGDDVKALQNILIKKGFLSIGNNSGYYGNLTAQAVVKYQSSNGLQSDGKAGLKTLEKINIESI
jgi:hypothetical protein